MNLKQLFLAALLLPTLAFAQANVPVTGYISELQIGKFPCCTGAVTPAVPQVDAISFYLVSSTGAMPALPSITACDTPANQYYYPTRFVLKTTTANFSTFAAEILSAAAAGRPIKVWGTNPRWEPPMSGGWNMFIVGREGACDVSYVSSTN